MMINVTILPSFIFLGKFASSVCSAGPDARASWSLWNFVSGVWTVTAGTRRPRLLELSETHGHGGCSVGIGATNNHRWRLLFLSREAHTSCDTQRLLLKVARLDQLLFLLGSATGRTGVASLRPRARPIEEVQVTPPSLSETCALVPSNSFHPQLNLRPQRRDTRQPPQPCADPVAVNVVTCPRCVMVHECIQGIIDEDTCDDGSPRCTSRTSV